MGLALNIFKNLSISKEEQHASLYHVLEDKVLVVVAKINDISLQQIIYSRLPLISLLVDCVDVIYFLLRSLGIQNLFIDLVSQCGRDSSFGILHKEGLVVLLQESFPNQNSFINELLIFIYSYLSQSDIEFIILFPKLIKRSCLQLQLDLTPREH